MSQDFNLRFSEIKQNNPTKNEGSAVHNTNHFENQAHIRNLCLVWPDNKKKFLNYAYLVSGEYLPDEGCITLSFTTDTAVIKGASLEGLFDDIVRHLPKAIVCLGSRYKSSVEENKPYIESIEVLPNK